MAPIIYEFPLNERMRTFMRLENSFAKVKYFSYNSGKYDSTSALSSLIETINIIDRNDIRQEILSELEKNKSSLSFLLNTPSVNLDMLQNTLSSIEQKTLPIINSSSKMANPLKEFDFLNMTRQRVNNNGTLQSFDLPCLNYWQNLSVADRQANLAEWIGIINPINEAVDLILDLVRNSSIFECCEAKAGFYQKNLSNHQTCQMIRVEVTQGQNYFPEFSGSKHRVNLRFLSYRDGRDKPKQVINDIDFDLSCCYL